MLEINFQKPLMKNVTIIKRQNKYINNISMNKKCKRIINKNIKKFKMVKIKINL